MNGVATFAGLSIDKAGSGYTLTAADDSLTGATSNTFTINPGPASQLVFTTSPVSGTASASATLGPLTVQRLDAFGNPVTAGSTTVNLVSSSSGDKFATTSGGAGVTSVTIGGGSSTTSFFYGDTVAGSPTITASTAGVTSATQQATINPGAASKLAVTSAAVSGTASSTANLGPITVQEQDQFGNPTTTATTVILSSNSTGAPLFSSTLNGPTTTSVSIPGGSSTVSFFYGDAKAGTPTVTAAASGLTSATQQETVNAAGAAKLAFTQQPSNSTGGVAFGTQPKVTVQDAFGNTVTSDASSVTLVIGTNPGTGTLSGTNTVTAVNGVATFSGLSIDKSGNGYRLATTDGGLTGATSNTFNITVGSAAKLAFTTQPGGGTAASAWAQQPVVTVQDAGGNTVTGSSASITLTIGTNPGGGALTCTANPKAAASGVATFAGCKINKAGSGYTLAAAASGLTRATSSPFNIAAGPAAKLTFTSSSGDCSSGSISVGNGGTWTSKVSVTDSSGNPTPAGSTTPIALSNDQANSLLSPTSLNIAVATSESSGSFSQSRTNGNTTYTVTASSSGLTSVSCAVKK